MVQLQKAESELRDLGFDVMAASIDPIERLQATLSKNDLSYRLVSDSGLEAAKKFGVVFRLDDATIKRYTENGIELVTDLLPVPAIFLIDSEGVIQFQYANPNYRVRPDVEILLAVARALASK